MSLHYVGCINPPPAEPCDLRTENRAGLCIECLTHLVRSERPPNWSPRVPRPDPTKPKQ